ncbi:MAG: 7-carboxy-7-deazaguanine synthase QueE [Candidatus Nitrosopelagicus sp.]|jgi:organic radical activating enzyme|nr:MAG: 7-carboxy-7-deazaguanine synthase QueE [Candidatus Nitrosopelagicus sp.]
MEKIRYSEIFYSVQGEGRFVGVPSVFFRVFGCNFNCHGFGQGRDKSKWLKPEEMPYATQDLSKIKHVSELPVVEIGCDASASWASRYKHLVSWDTVDKIAEDVTSYTPQNKWTCDNGQDVHFIITGGEPMLWQRETQLLLRQPQFNDLKNITIETNCTQPFKEGFDKFLQGLVAGDYTKYPVHVTWSTSPKLSISGEDWNKAIRPEVARQYADIPNTHLYFKFVVQDDQDLDEVNRARDLYHNSGVDADIWLMPMGATQEGQSKTSTQVADMAMKNGFKYSPRLHVDLFGNKWGT